MHLLIWWIKHFTFCLHVYKAKQCQTDLIALQIIVCSIFSTDFKLCKSPCRCHAGLRSPTEIVTPCCYFPPPMSRTSLHNEVYTGERGGTPHTLYIGAFWVPFSKECKWNICHDWHVYSFRKVLLLWIILFKAFTILFVDDEQANVNRQCRQLYAFRERLIDPSSYKHIPKLQWGR